MWTRIILMCVLQLQIMWVKPTLPFSSTIPSFFDKNADLRVTYNHMLGRSIDSTFDGCNKLTLFENPIPYFQALQYVVLSRARLLYKGNRDEMKALPYFLKKHSEMTIWIFAPDPVLANACYYGELSVIDEVSVKSDICVNQPPRRRVVVVSGAVKNDTKCSVVHNNKLHKV